MLTFSATSRLVSPGETTSMAKSGTPSKYPRVMETFLNLRPDLISMESKRKILWDNAQDLYRFPADFLPTAVREGIATART